VPPTQFDAADVAFGANRLRTLVRAGASARGALGATVGIAGAATAGWTRAERLTGTTGFGAAADRRVIGAWRRPWRSSIDGGAGGCTAVATRRSTIRLDVTTDVGRATGVDLATVAGCRTTRGVVAGDTVVRRITFGAGSGAEAWVAGATPVRC
jgi:hypothetical protein